MPSDRSSVATPLAAAGDLRVADRPEPGLVQAELAVAALRRHELAAVQELPGADATAAAARARVAPCRAAHRSPIDSLVRAYRSADDAPRPSTPAGLSPSQKRLVVGELAEVLVGDLGSVRAADRAVGVALDLELGELGAERLEEEQAADQRRARRR